MWLCLIAFGACRVLAQQPQHNVELNVVPRICILSEDSKECDEKVHLVWESAEIRSVCLYQGVDSIPLQCWENVSTGELNYSLSVDESVEFQLRDYHNDLIVLANTEFKVVHDKKKYRRSRRNPWSFF
ncbi:Protein of unknown function (DUF3019) [Alteromonadaceae bacterium 2753L.S.0a.02]|nr:Protein of unknown function (DUF3019) [Alteromonadaceae bacterium 2753L.S.0a.02]